MKISQFVEMCFFFSATDAANVQMRYRSTAGAAKLDGVVVK